MNTVYDIMDKDLTGKLDKICAILNVDINKQQNSIKIKQSLLKFLQDNSQMVLMPMDKIKYVSAMKLMYENQ